MSDKIYLGRRLSDLDIGEDASPISRVTVVVDSENVHTAGDDTGRMLKVQCPWGTQAMAESILSTMSTISYKPYSGSDSLLDPAAELGDGITAGGVYSVLAALNTSLDSMCLSGISAPATDEIDDEYPYKTKTQRSIERKLAATRSLITKTADEIRLEVQGLDERVTAVSVTLDGLTVTDESGTTKISGSSIETDTLSVKAANIEGLLSAAQIKLGGQMNVFESLDSDVSAGYFGYMDFTSNVGFSGTGLGIQSEGHAMITANGNMMLGCIGNQYIGSVSGWVLLSGKDLYWNGSSLITRIETIETILGALTGGSN